MDEVWLRQTKLKAGGGLGRAKADGKLPILVHSVRAANALAEAERRADPRRPCDFAARVASANGGISTVGRIVNISDKGARVEVMFPRRGPGIVMLHDFVNDNLYECQVQWRTDAFIGVRFIDILGPGRRRQYFAGEDVPLAKFDRPIILLAEPPAEYVLAGSAAPRLAVSRPRQFAVWRPLPAMAAPKLWQRVSPSPRSPTIAPPQR